MLGMSIPEWFTMCAQSIAEYFISKLYLLYAKYSEKIQWVYEWPKSRTQWYDKTSSTNKCPFKCKSTPIL